MDKFVIKLSKQHATVSSVIENNSVSETYYLTESKEDSDGQHKSETNEVGKKSNTNNSELRPQKRICVDNLPDCNLEMTFFHFRSITAENLKLNYARIFSKATADFIFRKLEEEVEYFSGDLLKVRVYGKWHTIPRKQVSYGDYGLSYAFSGNRIPAISWEKCNIIQKLRTIVESVAKHSFNFVLVNRYKDGMDHMGEHRDDERDLVSNAPIASLSFGQARDFIFKHKDARGVNAVKKIDPVKLILEHGSLLLMEHPTNQFWYHSLPVRKKLPNVRINLTFRDMKKEMVKKI